MFCIQYCPERTISTFKAIFLCLSLLNWRLAFALGNKETSQYSTTLGKECASVPKTASCCWHAGSCSLRHILKASWETKFDPDTTGHSCDSLCNHQQQKCQIKCYFVASTLEVESSERCKCVTDKGSAQNTFGQCLQVCNSGRSACRAGCESGTCPMKAATSVSLQVDVPGVCVPTCTGLNPVVADKTACKKEILDAEV